MALDLYMLGLIVKDMDKSLEFYRRLGVAIPEGSEGKSHVEVKMGNGLAFFLDSKPTRWDPSYVMRDEPGRVDAPETYPTFLEFYLQTRDAVEAKYAELTSLGYQSYHAPYKTTFGMCFAMLKDPDGNTILISGTLEKRETSPEA